VTEPARGKAEVGSVAKAGAQSAQGERVEQPREGRSQWILYGKNLDTVNRKIANWLLLVAIKDVVL
jgi:hypothetical protein